MKKIVLLSLAFMGTVSMQAAGPVVFEPGTVLECSKCPKTFWSLGDLNDHARGSGHGVDTSEGRPSRIRKAPTGWRYLEESQFETLRGKKTGRERNKKAPKFVCKPRAKGKVLLRTVESDTERLFSRSSSTSLTDSDKSSSASSYNDTSVSEPNPYFYALENSPHENKVVMPPIDQFPIVQDYIDTMPPLSAEETEALLCLEANFKIKHQTEEALSGNAQDCDDFDPEAFYAIDFSALEE